MHTWFQVEEELLGDGRVKSGFLDNTHLLKGGSEGQRIEPWAENPNGSLGFQDTPPPPFAYIVKLM